MSDSSSNNSSSSNKSDNSSPPDSSSSSSNNSNSNSNSAPSKNSPPDSALSTDSSSSNSNSDNASPNSSNSLSSSSDSPPSNNSPADSSKSDSSSSNSNGSTSPPSDGDNGDGGNDSSSPTNESKAAAPSKDDSSSSPLPPSSSSKSSPPPPQSNSDSSSSPSSKSESDSSPPPPSKSNKSPPPPSQGNESSPPSEGSSSPPKSPPPPAKQDSSSPPSQNSKSPSPSPPPPKSTSPPKEDSGNSTSPPDESSESYPPSKKKSPPPPDDGSSRSSPSKEDSPPPPPKHRDRDSTPSSSRDSAKSPKLSPSKGNGKDGQNDSVSSPTKKSSDSPTSSSGSDSGSVVGATVACVIFIVLIAIFFIMRSKRKRRNKMAYTTHFGPVSDQFSVTTDGYYYGPKGPQQQHQVGVPTHSQEYYGKPPPNPSFGLTSGFGSTRGPVNMGPDSGTFGNSQSCFSYKELVEITRGFAGDNIIGEGGFGCVHKGQMADGRLVAVKQLKVGSGQGEREFRAEVEIISRVHHRHLVSLVGYCLAEHHRLLVYEFVPNKTLEYHLHEVGLTVMEWSKRVKIAIGAARGLAYLHEDCHPKIIHRDIKSANILVDNDFEAQVADFGLAKLSTDTYTHVSTRVMGTFGYLAPEYAASGKLTDRSDVYSFGVVLLEIVTGRKPVDQTQPLGDESLVEWARPLLGRAIQTGDVSELVDPRLEKKYVESEMYRMIEAAAACVRHSAPKRPRMVQVLRALDTDGDMPDLTNGVKYGQSTVHEGGQQSEMQKFRKMAFGGEDSGESGMYSGEYNSREMPQRSQEYTSGELETRAINPRASQRY